MNQQVIETFRKMAQMKNSTEVFWQLDDLHSNGIEYQARCRNYRTRQDVFATKPMVADEMLTWLQDEITWMSPIDAA